MNQSVVNHSCVFAAQSDSRIAQQESPTFAVAPAQTYGNHSKRAQAHQELADIEKWCEEARYLESPDGQALNEGKAPEECPVWPDGTPLTHTIAQLSQWRTSSFLPESSVEPSMTLKN